MAATKEIWIQPGDTPALYSGEASRLILRGEPKIHFLRGSGYHSPYSEGGEEERGEFSSPVVSPVSKKTVAHWKKLGRAPESSALLRISVDPNILPPGEKLTLKAGSRTLELEVDETAEGVITKDMLLFVYGDGGVETLEGIRTVDVSKSGSLPFEATVEVTASREKRELGMADLLIKDPADGKFLSARYGLFKTRTPSVKLVCPEVGANNLRVLLDDGNEDTPDELDITKLIDPAGDVTDADLPQAVAQDGPLVNGEWEPLALRSRIYAEPPEDGKDLGVLLLGENRLRMYDTYSGELVYLAHFLLYEADDDSIVGSWYGDEPMDKDGVEVMVAADHVLLDFKEGAKNPDMASVLHALHMVPQGFSPDFRIVQASPIEHAPAATLKALVEKAVAEGLEGLESGGMDYVDAGGAPERVAMERYPEAFRADFNAGNGGFNNGIGNYFHHFYIHTFPAHRLIDHVRFGNSAPPLITLEGSHFLNKTFLVPAVKATIDALMHTRSDNPARKLAIFGHADASGSEVHNTTLSGLRAETAHALLVKDPDVWLRRLDGSPLVTETAWGTLEIQYMLKQLGHHTGSVNGVDDAPTRQASRRFLNRAGLPDHPNGRLDRAARRRLISDYMDNIVGPNPLVAADFHQDPAGNPARFACGENHLLIPSEPTSSQNRRVTFVLRRTPPPGPIDLTQRGAAAPYPAWIAPEPDAPAQGGDNPPFVVGCWDTGFGGTSVANPDNYSGENLDVPNRLFIRGRRIVRPTLIAAPGVANRRVFQDGDLSGNIMVGGTATTMSDQPPGGMHGTSVMVSMTADGIGNDIGGSARNAQQIVLGTGKDVKFRPLRQDAFDFQSTNQRYRIMTSDIEVKVVSTSLDVRHFELLTAAQQTSRTTLVRNMIQSGKLFFLAASNVRGGAAELGRRDVARTEGGFFAPDHKTKRSALAGANQFRRNIAAVGATSDVGNNLGVTEFPTSFTFIGTEISIGCPGDNIQIIQPAIDINGFYNNVNGMFIGPISGTSFSTPMTAGIAAEMMLANPILQQPANLPRVVEMIEATADRIPGLGAAPAAQQGRYLPGAAANVDGQLVAADLTDTWRRIHFWKAVLAALNDGLPTEQQIPNPAGGGNIAATSHFDQLTARDHAATVWYGFEVRALVGGCGIYFKRADGTVLRIEDTQAALPQGRRLADTWRRAQDYKAPAGHAQAGFVLPAYPFTGAAPAGITLYFMTQLSIKREELARFAHIAVMPPGIDPSGPDMARLPPMGILPLAQIVRMRNPSAITAPERAGNADLARIHAHVEEFDDFVFHWTLKPAAIRSYVLLHPPGANAGADFTVRVFAVDTLGCIKSDFNGPVNITHTGTNGTAGGTPTGLFINGAAAGASTAVVLAGGMGTFTCRNHTVQKFRLRASDGTNNDDGAGPEIDIGPPGATGSLRLEVTHFDGRDVLANPVRVGDRLKYTVTVLDAQGQTKTNFTGRVELKVIQGRMGADGPPKAGVHVAGSDTDPFSAAAFAHTFVAADRGRFEYSVFHYTTGDVQLQAVHGSLHADSPTVNVKAGALHQFTFNTPASQQAGNPATVEIRPRDRFGNLITDFSGRVNLSVLPPGMAGAVAGGVNSGVFIHNTQTAADDFIDFRDADLGAKQVQMTAYTAGSYQVRAASGAVTTDSSNITVNAPAAAAAFGFEVGASQHSQTQFPITVTALDAAGQRVPTFAGAVTLSRVSGPIANFFLTPHTYVAADNGRFTFSVRANTPGALVLRARSGAVQTDITVTIS